MNILFVNDIPFNPIGGGIERVTDILTKELKKRGYTIYYLFGKLSQSKLYLLNYTFPAKLFQLPNYGFFDDAENVVFYKKLQEELKLDVVVNQRGLGGSFNNILPITHTKIISVIHSTPESSLTSILNKSVISTVPPFANIKRKIKRTFPSIVSLYWKNRIKRKYNYLAYYSRAIVTLSPKYIDTLNHFINHSHQAKIISIPNPNSFDKIEGISAPKEKIVLYVGRLEKEQKEPLRLLKIWEFLHEKYSEWQLRIVGDGDEGTQMQDYVKKRGLKNVFFEGRQSNVAQYYQKAAFICLVSDYEGFPMVITEGMQYGCIPFTFNSFGAAFDVIEDGVDGCIIPAFDLKEYALRMSELMDDENIRFKMSKATLEKVKIFSVENVVNKWNDLFRSL